MTLPLTAPDLWTSARAMLTELFFLVTGTTAAHLQRLKRRERASLREWLAALEVMVRKVLLIEAAALAPSTRAVGVGPSASQSRRAVTGRKAPSFMLSPAMARAPHHPARIRMLGAATSLNELLRDKARAQRILALRNAPPPQPQARLANRINALARVIANPDAAIRRLARLLHKVKRIAFDIAAARVKTPFTFHGDANRITEERALAAALQLPNSS